jgi:polyisoprenoid-binding protein YceI
MSARLPIYAAVAALVLTPLAVVAQSPFTTEPAQVQAGTYELDASHGKVTWAVNHFGFSTYIGQFSGTAGTLTLDPKTPTASKLDVTVQTGSVGTLNEGLDTHLKSADFLDVAKFPTATFKATSIKLTGKTTADVAGDLTLHGVTKPIVLKAVFNQAGINPVNKVYTVGFDGETTIKRTDFGITTYAPAIGDEVKLTIEAEFKKVG